MGPHLMIDPGDRFAEEELAPCRDASSHDRITDRLNDVCLGILKFVKAHPGARIDEITLGMQNEFGPQTPDSIYNQIKRYLRDYLEFKGPKKSGGYHLKWSIEPFWPISFL